MKKVSPKLEQELFEVAIDSLKRGKEVRNSTLISSSLLLFTVLAFIFTIGTTETFLIALTIVVTSLCLIWAIMSMSASLNIQFDIASAL